MAKGDKISLCMIVKNEEKNIERCLNSIKDHVYEIIVVDTGSTDRTVELAKALGARVYFFEWINDFAAARNFSISKAKGDWILWMDADEYMTQPYIDNMKKLVASFSKTALSKETPKLVLVSIANMDNDCKSYIHSENFRLVKRDPRVRFKDKIHERVYFDSGEKPVCYNALSDILIMHTGYTAQAYEETGKLDRNEKLLLEQLESSPNDPRAYAHLADVYEAKKELDKALKNYKRALELSGSKENGLNNNIYYFHIIQNMVELNQPLEEILHMYEAASMSCPEAPDFDYQMGDYYRENDNNAKALEHYDLAIMKMEASGGKCFSMLITKIPLLYKAAADAAISLEDWGKTIRYLVCLLNANRYDMQVLQVFISVLLQHSGAGTNEIFALLLSIYEKSNPKDKLYLYKSTQLIGQMPMASDLLELIFELFTDEEKALL